MQNKPTPQQKLSSQPNNQHNKHQQNNKQQKQEQLNKNIPIDNIINNNSNINEQQITLNRQTKLFSPQNSRISQQFVSFQSNLRFTINVQNINNDNNNNFSNISNDNGNNDNKMNQDSNNNNNNNNQNQNNVNKNDQNLNNQSHTNTNKEKNDKKQNKEEQNKQQHKQASEENKNINNNNNHHNIQVKNNQQNKQPQKLQHNNNNNQEQSQIIKNKQNQNKMQQKQPQTQKQQQHKQPQQQQQQPPKQLIQACLQISKQLLLKSSLQQIRKQLQQKIVPLYQQFCTSYNNLLLDIQIQQSINTYSQILVKYWDQQMFFQHFVQNKYLHVLMTKIKEHKYADIIIKAVFGCLQYLLKGLGNDNINKYGNREQQFIYLLVMINKQGFITQNYKFMQVQNWAYYAHFMKLLVRIINQADKAQQIQLIKQFIQNQQKQADKSNTITFNPIFNSNITNNNNKIVHKPYQFQDIYSKYLTIFFNQKIPQFPLLLKLLYFYKWPDTILQTSVKLCLLEISNHPNRKLQKYLLNFPFVTFYLFYCNKISENIQKYLTLSSQRRSSQKQSQKQQILLQQIIADMKFMQDYLKIQQQTNIPQRLAISNIKITNIQQHLYMYINTFIYYIGRGFYQNFNKFIVQENINGLINGMLFLIKIMKINTILKIKLGFQEMLHKYINVQLWEFLKGKRQKMDTQKYWIFDQCADIIRQHAQNILYNNNEQQIKQKQKYKIKQKQDKSKLSSISKSSIKYQSQSVDVLDVSKSSFSIKQKPQVAQSTINTSLNSNSNNKPKKSSNYSSTFFKAVRSYIPNTNSNWLYYQMKKMSQVLGLQVSLNKQIQHYSALNPTNSSSSTSYSYYKNSFLYIIDTIQQNNLHANNTMVLNSKKSLISRFTSPIKINSFFTGIMALGSKKYHNNSNNGSGNKNEISNIKNTNMSIMKKINQDNTQQLIYYYLILMCSIKDNHSHKDHQNMHNNNNNSNININNSHIHKLGNFNEDNINIQQISQLLKITKKCRSLMLVGIMYWYIKILDYQLHQTNLDFDITNQNYNDRELHNLYKPQKQIQKAKSGKQSNKQKQEIKEKLKNSKDQQKQKQKDNTIASQLLQIYTSTMQKLVYYVLSEGWQTFIKHIRSIKNVIWRKNNNFQVSISKIHQLTKKPSQNNQCTYQYEDSNKNPMTQFVNDIFRDIECDIVYFVMMRHIFGTRNIQQQVPQVIDNGLQDKDIISKQIKVPCRLTNAQGDKVYLIMDGQYIKFMTIDDILITKKPLSVNCFNIYQQESSEVMNYQSNKSDQVQYGSEELNKKYIETQIKQKLKQKQKKIQKKNYLFQLVDKNMNGQCFTVYFQQLPIREYVAKQIKWRKKMTMNIQMCLRTMRFDIQS